MIRRDVHVRESGHVGRARVLATHCARTSGLSEDTVAKVALATTELATNLLRHAKEGVVMVENGVRGFEVVAVDAGPGIAAGMNGMRDGYSTVGGLGGGLGAVRRAADDFDLYSQPATGTVVLARWRDQPGAANRIGAVRTAAAGETACGDVWTVVGDSSAPTVMVCDGLGHGPRAAEASARAVALAERHRDREPDAMLGKIAAGLVNSRGAAIALARLDPGRGELRFVGVGNISAFLYAPDEPGGQALISRPGIVGVPNGPNPRPSTHPWVPGSTLLMHTDGVHSRWSLRDWPGLRAHDTTTCAAWLLWQANRRRDDACVLVVDGGQP